MERIVESGLTGATALEPFTRDGIPEHYAALGRGTRDDGKPVVVAFAPAAAGDALLAALAAARGSVGEGDAPFDGQAIAIAPHWSAAALQRLSYVGELPFELRGLVAPALADGACDVVVEAALPVVPVAPAQVASQLASAEERALFLRAASALEGLASKHGGAVRSTASAVELVLVARRVAALRAEQGVMLETFEPQRSTQRIAADDLAGALDRLEGQLRKRLNDRRVRDSEEGKRAGVAPLLAQARDLRSVVSWPLGGSDREVIDFIGVDASGQPVAAAVREELNLAALGNILDAVTTLQPALAVLLAGAEAPLRLGVPRLAIAAEGYSEAAVQVLASLAIGFDLFQLRAAARGFELVVIDSAETAPRSASRGPRGQRGQRGGAARGRDRASAEAASAGPADSADDRPVLAPAGPAAALEPDAAAESENVAGGGEEESDDGARRVRRRGRRRRGGRGSRDEESGAEREDRDSQAESTDGAAAFSEPLEVSLFDLGEESSDDEGEGSRPRRRRGRGRGRGRRGSGDDETAAAAGPVPGGAEGEASDPERAPRSAGDEEGDADVVDLDDSDASLALLSEDAPDFDEVVPEPSYDVDDIDEEGDSEDDRRHIEREKRRLARQARAVAQEAPAQRPPPRRRAAIVAHADRDSVLSAVLLARDLRLIEGIWVYGQSELMNFFRTVTSDLRDDTPICVVGFTPSPAGEVLQMASLYASRLQWFDHHDWPPEDLDALRSALGEDAVHVTPGAGSSLPAVLSTCSRRSRFSDKLVDLCAGRFTPHDFERWGRVWWWRLAEYAKKPGDRRSDLEPLLAGRPSDLAKEAARVEAPSTPEEVAFVSQHDFRIVHFAGYTMVVVEAPEEYNLHLCARIARERYEASFTLATHEGSELLVLTAEDVGGKRGFDLGAVIVHLAEKLEYVEPLADADHVARFRARGLVSHPERLDEVIAEIAMGRSLLEG
jgi:hypothetical protein